MGASKRPEHLAELRNDRDLAWRIIQHAPAGIVHVLADGSILSANPTALRLLGLSYDELAQRYTHDFATETLWEDGSPCAAQDYPVSRALLTGEPQPEVVIGVRKPDGELSWALFTAIPVKDPATGVTSGAVVTILDITQRKRIEEALRDSEAMLRSIITSAPSVLVTADLDGIIQFVSRSNNPSRSAASYIGLSIYDIPNPRDLPTVRACVERVLATGEPDGCEVQVDRGGSAIAYSLRVGPVNKGDQVVGISMLATDVTELKALQNQVMISDRLASIGTLAAGVAHEINNPLTYIIMSLQRARDSLRRDPAAVDRALTDLDAAIEGATRIGRVVRDLGELSRPPEEESRPVDIREVLELAIHMAHNQIRYRARVMRDYRPIPKVAGDKTRLGQVFLNLLVNAAQAIDAGDVANNEIRISTGDTGAGQVTVTIDDTGYGIPAELIGHVFEPFVTSKEIGEGTGLGLYICHKIVSSLGGKLAVDSRLGNGTTITVTLPAAAESAPGTEPRAEIAPRAPHTTLRILVVDDEPLIVGFFEQELAHHELVVARSGREGIEILRDKRFDLVFCDLIMPDLTGMDIHEFLGRENPEQRDAIVFMTGGAFTPRAKEFLSELPNPVLEKPFAIEQVERLVDEAMRRHHRAARAASRAR